MAAPHIAIIDYNCGNLKSIRNMFRKIGFDSTISADPDALAKADRLILPGVGHFDHGMRELNASGLAEVLKGAVRSKEIPLLGICLGAQLLGRGSEEGTIPGLGLVDADTVGFDRSRLSPKLRVPHMGWADVDPTSESKLFDGIEGDPRFYFVHAFHLRIDKPEKQELCASTHGYRFPSGVRRGHIAGMQFHPEKSHRFGMQVLRNFVAHGVA